MTTTSTVDDSIVMWGIHAGRTGDAHGLFLNRGKIAIGFLAAGPVADLPANRDAFKEHVAEKYTDKKPGAIPNIAGQIFRFVHVMKPNDLVVYPSKTDKQVHIGRITGEYEYTTSDEPGYPHRRAVEWFKHVPRTRFTQGALYEIGSALSLFQVKNYVDEFRAVVDGTTGVVMADSTSDDETVAAVAEEIEQATSDFILKQLAKELKGHPFAQFVAELLEKMGYRTRVAPPGPDGGVDIVAHKDELGFEPPIIKVQVKSTTGSVGDPETSALYGKVAHGEFGLLVTLGTFTKQAVAFANTKANLRLIDGEEVVRLVLDHYEALDSRYKGVIPLKRVYVPQAIEDDSTDG
jgi:restriction system protein